MLFESLESRQFLAADPLAGASSVGIHMRLEGNTLRVTTLSADNTISVWKGGIYTWIDVASSAFDNQGKPIASRQENRFDTSKVRKIVIDSGAGNDTITVSGKIKADTTVYAGAGSDTVSTGAGNDRLYGDADLDCLVGNAGDDFVDGGAGDDRITATGGTDNVWGNAGNDRLTVASFGHRVHGGPGSDIATLRDAPHLVTSIERYTRNQGDLVPAPVNANGIGIVDVSAAASGAVSMVVSTLGQRYAYSVTRGDNTGRVDVTLLAYQQVGDLATATNQTLYVGKFKPGQYTFTLRAGDRTIDSAAISVV